MEVNVATTGMLAFKPSRVQKASSKGTASTLIALLALSAIVLHLVLRFVSHAPRIAWQAPLVLVLIAGGLPLVVRIGISIHMISGHTRVRALERTFNMIACGVLALDNPRKTPL